MKIPWLLVVLPVAIACTDAHDVPKPAEADAAPATTDGQTAAGDATTSEATDTAPSISQRDEGGAITGDASLAGTDAVAPQHQGPQLRGRITFTLGAGRNQVAIGEGRGPVFGPVRSTNGNLRLTGRVLAR